MKPRMKALIVASLAVSLASAAVAKKNNPNIELDFVPQQTVAGAEANVAGAMLERAVAVRFVDARRGDDPSKIGMRTDDDDRRHDLHATSDVLEFVETHFVDSAYDWGVDVDDAAGLTLEVKLMGLEIVETNQAVGATYNATVRLAYSLSGGSEAHTGAQTGDATRYGKKFSNANANEVLSDALLEVYAAVLSDPALQRAWGE